ncbi:hypothetical protein FH972_003132 [Carpinus fangiana]|uniref:F-box domain-containing protein n=1 Tax=Carpinus fangiana TaxID=176857 RepID=A0A5N6QGY8_9ROSI|nr:hypothetical protein FH972_003132 [Carpinus fangiana]KAE7998602.1 hypothetical protein FH972_003132 [Carpinus fangiana]KAE7998603.1 hypothetical protein FH972_003132 [Carpinus fangiana]
MEELPPSLIVDILSRLTDSAELGRCRLVSKTFNSLSYEVRSVRLFCTLSRYLKSRAPETKFLVTPFKTVLNTLVCDSQFLESVSIGVDKSLGNVEYDDVEDESDDLYLTDVRFVKEWLPRIAERLRSLSVSDFWFQSCWRKSEVLSLISSCCHTLHKLEVKNAWLSVDGLNPMPTLTSLTLEFIRLDDEDLNKVNNFFPCLKVLNLIGVGGLKEPKIHLLHLKTCHWTVSNAPLSVTIFGPNLVNLTLKCVKPQSLVLETPSLSDFHLTLEEANEFKVKGFPHLKNLQLQSVDLCNLICMFPSGRTVKKLTMNSPHQKMTRFSLETVFDVFPNLTYLNLGASAWMQAEDYFVTRGLGGRIGMKVLKEIVAHMVTVNEDATLSFIFSILDKCTNLSVMALMIYPQIGFLTASDLVSRCRTAYPRVTWKWEMLKEGKANV